MLQEDAQKCCGVSVHGDIKNSAGHGLEQPTLADPALSRRAEQVIPEGAVPPQMVCSSAQSSMTEWCFSKTTSLPISWMFCTQATVLEES